MVFIDHDISNRIVDIMDFASSIHNIESDENLIDANILNIQGVENDEDMAVAICYIAECYTFEKKPDFKNMQIDFLRNHIVDVFISLI